MLANPSPCFLRTLLPLFLFPFSFLDTVSCLSPLSLPFDHLHDELPDSFNLLRVPRSTLAILPNRPGTVLHAFPNFTKQEQNPIERRTNETFPRTRNSSRITFRQGNKKVTHSKDILPLFHLSFAPLKGPVLHRHQNSQKKHSHRRQLSL